MADEDAVSAAQRRRSRTGRSFFPAANKYPQGSLDSLRGAGYDPSLPTYPGGSIPPEQNPAYQAAINRPRQAMRTITLPSGGTTTVPELSAAAVYNLPGLRAAYDRSEIQGRLAYPQNYALGYGAVTQPPITAQQRVQSGQAGFGDFASVIGRNIFGRPDVGTFAAGVAQQPATLLAPTLGSLARNYLGGFGQNLSRWFGGGQRPSAFGGGLANAAMPSPTPPPIPSPTPFKTADDRTDLLNQINGTFYGGGHAPIPTPTPTPYGVPRLAYGQPRRYSDYYG